MGSPRFAKEVRSLYPEKSDIADQRGAKSRVTGGHMSERVIKGPDDCSFKHLFVGFNEGVH